MHYSLVEVFYLNFYDLSGCLLVLNHMMVKGIAKDFCKGDLKQTAYKYATQR